jgi:hypothetical protein
MNNMYVIGLKDEAPEWEVYNAYFIGELEDAKKERDYLRKQSPQHRFEVFECNILQTLDPEVFLDKDCPDCETNSGIDLT